MVLACHGHKFCIVHRHTATVTRRNLDADDRLALGFLAVNFAVQRWRNQLPTSPYTPTDPAGQGFQQAFF